MLLSRVLQPTRGAFGAVLTPWSSRLQSTRAPTSQMPNLMDIGSRSIFDEDNDMFRESVRKFMREEVGPRQLEFEEAGVCSKEIWLKCGQQGLLGVSIPAEVEGIVAVGVNVA